MVLRTYLDKNNTIITNSELNTGQNPVSELFYGATANGEWAFSRLLIFFDIDKLNGLYVDGMLGDLSKTKHYLKLTNTISFNNTLLNTEFVNKKRTSSFKLIAREINIPWDEGVGYDFNYGKGTTISKLGSNWFNATTANEWEFPGDMVINEEIISECNFDKGNENLVMDVTEWVNSIIKGETQNYGLSIGFESELESEPETISTDDINKGVQYVGFFTRHTQTFYKPFIETHYQDYIRDDRRNFYIDKPNKLYLYVNANNEPKNLDNLPTVNIYDNMSQNLNLGLTVNHVKKGVYMTEVNLNLDGYKLPTYFSDIWSNINIDGQSMNDVQLGFEVKSNNTFYDIGMGVDRPQDYKVVISGINHNENITIGEIRRVNTNALIPYTVDQKVLLDNIEYRIYVKEGEIEHNIIDFEPVERSYKDNYFMLDTTSLLPNQKYYLDVRLTHNSETKISKKVLNFNVV